ncbi:MAG: histidine--tRNA ligase [Lachnospiraceae bacterium]|jgi:histidyl-tRNA synthetase|nr:histidine--tRNA ligase [Lachnospiraceae bacterium]
MGSINTKPLSGFMELLPEEQVAFDNLKATIESTYQQFGFASLDTPLIERSEVLLAKGGEDINRQIYLVTNGLVSNERSDQALRFDLTVPLARYVAEHFNDLVFPFRRCHIGKVYRGERAQRGRFREFYQCDIDVIGRNELSIRYDAEIPSIIYQLFRKLDLGKFNIRINNRKVLNGLFNELGISAATSAVLRIIDKADKARPDDLLKAFREEGLAEKQIKSLVSFIGIKGDIDSVLKMLGELKVSDALFQEGVDELKTVTDLMLLMGVDADYFTIDLSIARGLDYYTGTVYETILEDSRIGSVCSGGRFDNLAGHYTTEKLPGVGISIGLTRLFWQLRENDLLKTTYRTIADVVVVPESDQNLSTALSISNDLRIAGLKVDVYLEESSMKKKLQYVSRKEARFTVVVKSEESGIEVLSLQYKDGDVLNKEQLSKEDLLRRVAPNASK